MGWVIISMIMLCYANASIEYDRGSSRLSDAPLHIT